MSAQPTSSGRDGRTARKGRNTRTTWRNWAGNVAMAPNRTVSPSTTDALAEAVRRAAEDGLRVKAVGTGHSFTAAAVTDGMLIRPERLVGIRGLDRDAGTVTGSHHFSRAWAADPGGARRDQDAEPALDPPE